MSLSELRGALPKIEVATGATSFFVQGLSLTNVSQLILRRREDVSAALEAWSDAEGDMGGFITRLLTELPALVAEVIAQASGEPDAADVVERLPVAVQVEALEAVATLTFVDLEQAGKFLATVLRGITAAGTLARKVSGGSPAFAPTQAS